MSIYWLLIAMPAAAALEIAGAAAPVVFFVAALAIVPLAALIVHSTEHLSAHTGAALGGLLDATFGNLPELIIAIVALRAGLVDMVRASPRWSAPCSRTCCWRSASPFCSAACVIASRSTTRPPREATTP